MLAFYQNGFLKRATQASTRKIHLTQDKYNSALKDGIGFEENSSVPKGINKIRVMVFHPVLQALGSAILAVR